ncbi:hypothetical protein B0J11DRAFT_604174 [Dendryphion nanum]|uniref:Uncharacterized protein n=1 Tax=Dendryphion nanum TaxID=256645 RepID=A0A9P9E0Y6_9PLEO|nr:hypothetical protein B0J11DRAFT_604174 [Dendryphion nanum]
MKAFPLLLVALPLAAALGVVREPTTNSITNDHQSPATRHVSASIDAATGTMRGTNLAAEDCEPGALLCNFFDDGTSWVVICSPGRRWILHTKCGSNFVECCAVLNNLPYCICGAEPQDESQLLPESRSGDVEKRAISPSEPKVCKPGQTECFWDSRNRRSAIFKCEGGLWEHVEHCGETQSSCKFDGNSVPYCDHHEELQNAKPETRDLVTRQTPSNDAKIDDDMSQLACTPGETMCVINLKLNQHIIYLCVKESGKWVKNKFCGPPGCCKQDYERGIAYCDCRKRSLAPDTSQSTSAVVDRVEKVDDVRPFACTLGETLCRKNNSEIWVCVHESGKWALNNICGGKNCCKKDARGIAYCDCRQRSAIRQSSDTTSSLPEVVGKSDGVSLLETCSPGASICVANVNPLQHEVWICSDAGRWVKTSVCGHIGCCRKRYDHEMAHCWPCLAQQTKRELRPGTVDLDTSLSNSEKPEIGSQLDDACWPGITNCGVWKDGNKSYVLSCDATRRWIVQSECGQADCCRYSAELMNAFCDADCKNKRTTDGDQPASPALEKSNKAEAICSHTCTSALASCKKMSHCQMRQCREDICLSPRWECDASACGAPCALNIPPKESCSAQPKCTPDGFGNMDECLNVCGVRYPPCFQYCTCQSSFWPGPGRERPQTTLQISHTAYPSGA